MTKTHHSGDSGNIKVIWAERLTVLDCLYLYIKCLMSHACVHYNKHGITRNGAIILNVLKIFRADRIFIDVKLTLQTINAPRPHQIRDRVDDIIDMFLGKRLTGVPEWKTQMVRAYIASSILGKVEFVAMVEAKKGDDAVHHEIFLERDPINSVLKPFLESRGFHVLESVSFLKYFLLIMRPVRDFYRALLGCVTNREDGFPCGTRPAVWVEYNDLVLPLDRFYLFWYGYVDTTNFDVVCYFDRTDTKLDSNRTNALEKERLKWVDCADPLRLAHFNLTDIYALIKSLLILEDGHTWWLRLLWIRYQIFYEAYRLVFRSFRVKMLMQHQEGLWLQMPQAKAIEEEGGIMVGFHWSNYPLPNIQTHLKPQQVFFVWGKAMLETLYVNGNSCLYILPSGLWMLPRDELLPNINQVFDACDFILGIFDSSVAHNAYQTPEALELFYVTILELLEKNRNWGGVIKSKKWGVEDIKCMLPQGSKIAEHINKLIQDKRVVFLDYIVNPVSVAIKVDLSVCFGFSSVGVLAGALGRKAIHWDCAGYINHPIYRNKQQKVLYLSLEEFKNAIIISSKGDVTIGDFSLWKKDFNYFNDLLVPQRVGRFISNYMEEVIATADANHSMDFSAKLYMEENSVSKDFFEITNWWGPLQSNVGREVKVA